MDHVIVRWQAQEYEHSEKERPWYYAVGIVAGGVAIASLILQNYLFAVICVIGGFTVMLVGSARPPKHTYSLTEKGFMVGKDLIPFEKMTRFSISEDEPRHLTIESKTLIGIVKAPLEGVDFREIRMELKNYNIQEEEKLDTLVDRVAKTMGL
jgi:hypothetical protein